MNQVRFRSIRSLLLSVALASAFCLVGCAGAGKGMSRLDFDPMLGGRPLPERSEAAGTKEKRGDEDPLLMPSGDSGKSPAALAASTERSERKEEKEAAVRPPRVEVPSPEKVMQASVGAPSKPAEASYEQLQQRLEAKGVVWQHLKTTGERGEWVFACSIPDPNQSGVERHYESKVVGSFGLAAMRAVLADIEADQKP